MSDSRLTTGALSLNERTELLRESGEQIGALERLLASSQHEQDLARRIIEKKRDRNSLVPINQLPTELLIDIFWNSILTDQWFFMYLTRISSVAWLWKRIIDHAPRLWATVDWNTHVTTKLLPIIVQRAGDFPLTVHMPGPHIGWDDESSRPRNAPFLETVLPKLARWKKVYLFLQYGRPDLLERLEMPAPLLKSCEVEAQNPWQGPSVDLFRGHAPSLAEIEIRRLPLQWSSSLFQNLRSISIYEIMERGPTIEDVLHSILSSPRLDYFCLQECALSPSTSHRDILPVKIPHLRTLFLLAMRLSCTHKILSHLQAPALRRFIVQPNSPDAEENHDVLTLFNESLLHFNSNIYSSIISFKRLWITIDSRTGEICFATPPLHPNDHEAAILVHFYHQRVMQGLRWCLETLLQDVPVCPSITFVILESEGVPESDLLWMMDSQINDKVTKIDIRTSDGDAFLPFLCTGRPIQGVVKWPFPKLRRLLLKEQVSGTRLVHLLKQRYAPDLRELSGTLPSSSQSTFILEAPDRLTFLDVDDPFFHPYDYEGFVHIIGARAIAGDDYLSESSESSSSSSRLGS